MNTQCILCERLAIAIEGIVLVGDLSHPVPEPLCRSCADLRPEQRQGLRDQAMARILRRDSAALGKRRLRHSLTARPTVLRAVTPGGGARQRFPSSRMRNSP